MLTTETISDIIAKAIASIKYPEAPFGLYAPIEYTLESGGKRLRPQLTLSVCSALGADVSRAIDAALGIEIFHNFTLLHDDVMDSADIRRGRLTVHKRWNDNTAILSGDAMLTMAVQYIARTPSDVMPQAMELFNRTAMEVYEGQQYDMDFERSNNVTVPQYIEMIRLKTSVLLGCACRMGAIVACAPDDVAQAFYDYGVNLGLAFQLKDDWLDTFGDPLVFGKQIGGDIINAKKTWLLINALSECRDELLDILAEDLEPEERISQVTAVYNRLNLSERCNKLIAEYSERAIMAIDAIELSSDAKDYFVSLAKKSVERTH
ncbi:MAG: polyprenyl synthetase family protein [Muribaculaceae bacterium]|nr:polyprenyl synthetase family protein [Muribaculaceae bacterium]